MSVITPSGLPTELTEITNGETLIEVYNPDTGQNEKTEVDTIKTYIQEAIESSFEAIVLNTIFPIGKRVVQLPGESSPSTLYASQTWTNISSSFAGDFFRVEGGDANTYDSGEQLDQMQGHWHDYFAQGGNANGGSNGALSTIAVGTTTYTYTPIRGVTTDGENGTPRVGDSTYPINHTIRIWERTA
jgi:hypothetical protein